MSLYHDGTWPVVCLFVSPCSHLFVSIICFVFFLCTDSPDSAVWVLSPTGNPPKSWSRKRNWGILGITLVWWRTLWGRTTPLAPLTSKAVSTESRATSGVAQMRWRCCCCCDCSLANWEICRRARKQACKDSNTHGKQLVLAHYSVEWRNILGNKQPLNLV